MFIGVGAVSMENGKRVRLVRPMNAPDKGGVKSRPNGAKNSVGEAFHGSIKSQSADYN
jgi:hypothetical protein